MHKGTLRGYRAALGRFEDATKYDPNSAEAFFRLGEAQEKLKNKDGARAAFEKVLHLAPDSKLAHDGEEETGQQELVFALCDREAYFQGDFPTKLRRIASAAASIPSVISM